MSKVKIVDRSEEYKSLVTFIPNLTLPFHRWYELSEGYSSELVRLLICEQEQKPSYCLDPFGGIGTTSLTCQQMGIKCISFENNPFFVDVAKAKLNTKYNSNEYKAVVSDIQKKLNITNGRTKLPQLESRSFFESRDRQKWIFHKRTALGITDVLNSIKELSDEYSGYIPILKCALGELLLEVSNVFRYGKALGYKSNWQENRTSRKEVHRLFLENCDSQITDLKSREFINHNKPNNANLIYLGDAVNLIEKVKPGQLDLVVTSPPYLNSRDYTDIYKLELWILNYVTKYEDERAIRRRALTSHVQLPLPNVPYPSIPKLRTFVEHLERQKVLWNKNLPNMVKGYFNDMSKLFESVKSKLKKGGRMYINVSNSAYYSRQIEVDKVLSDIALRIGFRVPEIRIARWINPSGQQKNVGKIRESIIVIEKP